MSHANCRSTESAGARSAAAGVVRSTSDLYSPVVCWTRRRIENSDSTRARPRSPIRARRRGSATSAGERARERTRIRRRNDQARDAVLVDPWHARRESVLTTGSPTGHRFDLHHAEGLLARLTDGSTKTSQACRAPPTRHRVSAPSKPHAAGHARRSRAGASSSPRSGPSPTMRAVRSPSPWRDEHVDTLVRHQPSDEQHRRPVDAPLRVPRRARDHRRRGVECRRRCRTGSRRTCRGSRRNSRA